MRREPWLWATLISASLSLLFFVGPIEVLLPFVVRNGLHAGAAGFGAVLAATGAGAVVTSLVMSQTGAPRRYLTFMYGVWGVATLPFLVYAFGGALWQFLAVAILEGACMTGGQVVWGTLMSTRVPAGLRGRVHSLDWFVSIGLTPLSFALTGPVSQAIGVESTLVVAAVVPALAMVVLYFAAGLRRDEERYADAVSGAPATAAGSSTPAIS